MNLKQLRQALEDAKTKGRKLAADLEALENKAELTDDEQAKLDALAADLAACEAEVTALAGKVARAEAKADRERLFAGTGAADDDERPGRREAARTLNEPDPARTHGFRHLGEFAQSVMLSTPGHSRFSGQVDERLFGPRDVHGAPTNFHREGGSDEGYMVPPEYRERIFELVFADEDLLGMVDAEPTRSNSVGLGADESTPWGSSGISANWRAEGTQMTADKLNTDERQVKLHELYAFCLATEELLEDAPRLNARLSRRAPEAIKWKASDAIMWGTGAGQPLGWMNGGCKVSVPKESEQAAKTVVAANVANMYSRMLGSSVQRAVWLANIDVAPQLMTMTLGDQPIWTPPSSGFKDAPGGFLLGRPIRWSDHCDTLGDEGDLQFIDPMGYYLAHKADGITFAESMHLYFDYNMRAFRWTFRLGGQPHLEAAVTPARSAATRSHFVTLAVRD